MLAIKNYADLIILGFNTKDNRGLWINKKSGKAISQIIEYKNADKVEKKNKFV